MGYDAKLVLGNEGHNSVHGAAILPDALRWLWRDYPNRITTPRPPDGREWATNIVKPDKDWEVVAVPMRRPKALAADHDGNVFIGDGEGRRIYKIARDGTKVTPAMPNTEPIDAMAIGADGSLYTAHTGARRIVTYSPSGTKAVVTTKGNPTGLTVTRSGTIYYTDAGHKRVWFIDAAGRARVVHEGIMSPTGVQLSAGGTLLIVADESGRSAWSFQVQPDGTLDHGEPFYRLETSDYSAASQASAVTIDLTTTHTSPPAWVFKSATYKGGLHSSLQTQTVLECRAWTSGVKDSGCYTRLRGTRCFGGPSAAQAPKCGDSDRMAE